MIVYDEGGLRAELTTDSAASSYGRPVLRLSGHGRVLGDYGPAERIPIIGRLAGAWVQEWASQPERSGEEREAARRFGFVG